MRHFPLMLLAAVVMTLTSCGEDSFLNRREFVDYGDKASELLLRVDWDTYADGRPTACHCIRITKRVMVNGWSPMMWTPCRCGVLTAVTG